MAFVREAHTFHWRCSRTRPLSIVEWISSSFYSRPTSSSSQCAPQKPSCVPSVAVPYENNRRAIPFDFLSIKFSIHQWHEMIIPCKLELHLYSHQKTVIIIILLWNDYTSTLKTHPYFHYSICSCEWNLYPYYVLHFHVMFSCLMPHFTPETTSAEHSGEQHKTHKHNKSIKL